MIQTENTIREPIFSFSGLNRLSEVIVSDETILRAKRRANDLVAIMKNAINNFLKTPEEIEAEFCVVMNSYVDISAEEQTKTDQYKNYSRQRDGHTYNHTPEEIFSLSGDMEENY